MTQYSTVRKSRFFSTRFSQGVWKSVCLFGFTAWKYSGKRKKCFFLRVEKAWKRFIFNSFSTYRWGQRKTSAKIRTKACGFRNDGQLFLFERKSCKKKQKSLQDLSGFVSAGESRKERASPRRDVYFVPRKHSAEPQGEVTLHGFVMFCKRAIGANITAYCPHRGHLERSNALALRSRNA